MKKTFFLAIMFFAVLNITAWSAQAQMKGEGQGMMKENGGQQESMRQVQRGEQYFMPGMPGCYGMGPGMMMGGYGMGPGMMMGHGMGPGMMGSGMGHMKRHMMEEYGWEPGGMRGFGSSAQYEKFLDATRDMRKKMHDMRFEYGEMMRNPATTMGDLKKMEQEMLDLQKKIMEQAGQE